MYSSKKDNKEERSERGMMQSLFVARGIILRLIGLGGIVPVDGRTMLRVGFTAYFNAVQNTTV